MHSDTIYVVFTYIFHCKGYTLVRLTDMRAHKQFLNLKCHTIMEYHLQVHFTLTQTNHLNLHVMAPCSQGTT